MRSCTGLGRSVVAALEAIAARSGPLVEDALVLVLFQACLRRAEAAALVWGDIETASLAGALRIRVRTSKTNAAGEETDIRLVKGDAARALEALRPAVPDLRARVFGLSASSIGGRFRAAAARAGYRASAHSAAGTRAEANATAKYL